MPLSAIGTTCQWIFGHHEFCEKNAKYLVTDSFGNEAFLCEDHFMMLFMSRVHNITKIVSLSDGKDVTSEYTY
ncbi:MAG: hypothetical protein AAB443_02830 [Patescibacteria group bacterium]